MKRFLFPLSAALKAKEIREKLRVRELAAANALYLAERQKRDTLRRQQDDAAALVAKQAGRTLQAGEALAWRDHFFALGDQAAAQEAKLQQVSQVVEKKREEVVTAARETQMLERLKQKRFEEYRAEHNRLVQLEIDEVAQRLHRKNFTAASATKKEQP